MQDIKAIAAQEAEKHAKSAMSVIFHDGDTELHLRETYMLAFNKCLELLAGSEGDIDTVVADLRNKITPFMNVTTMLWTNPSNGDKVHKVMMVELDTCVEYMPLLKSILKNLDTKIKEYTTIQTAKMLGNRWIPVSERLPEFDTWVLCYCKIYGFYIGSYQRILDTCHGNWNDGKDLGVLPPIYWQPLPQSPNK